MRLLKWIAGIALVLVLVAIIVHLRRDTIARDIANSMLEEQGFSATELSVESLSGSLIEFDSLVIESNSGARYEVTGLSLPLSISDDEISVISADSLVATYDTARDKQTMLSTTLETVFEMPFSHTSIDVRVGSIMLPNTPELRNVALQANANGMRLAFALGEIEVAAALARDDAGHSRLAAGAKLDGASVMKIDLAFTRDRDRYTASGEVSAQLAAWMPLFAELGVLPAGLEELEVPVSGSAEISFDETAPGTATASLLMSVGAAAQISHTTDNGRRSQFAVTSAPDLSIDYAYPANAWTARIEKADGVFSTDGLSETPMTIADLECRKGTTCTLQASVESQPLTWNEYTVDAATMSLPLTVTTEDQLRVQVAANAAGSFSGLMTDGIAAATVTITGFSGTEILVADPGWRCTIDELELAFDNLALANNLLVTLPATMTELDIGNSGETIASRISINGPIDGTWDDVAVSLPGVAGSFEFEDEALQATVDIIDPNDAVAGAISWRRNTATDSGSLEVRDGWASFDRARLSDYVQGLEIPVDILQGNWDVDLALQWESIKGVPQYRGTATMELDSIGGTYADIAMVGLATRLTATLEPATGLTLVPAPVAVRLVDVGVPIENIVFEYDADLDRQAIRVSDLALEVFGGDVTADPFTYAFSAAANSILLHVQSIQLQLMVDTLGFETIEMTGSISGDLPVTMTGKEITINDGQLEGGAEGGTIRYAAGDDGLGSTDQDSGLGVLAALANFEYESLTSTVNYVEGGNMKVLMRLVGISPDYDPDQPFAYNLNLDNNIPQMLRSLRAVRSIEDILKQRTEN